MAKQISLTQGKVALIDDVDFDRVKQFKWCASNEHGLCYAIRRIYSPDGKRLMQRMHRLILGLQLGDKRHCDHVNHDGLDNQRHNLRICTCSQNHQNTISKHGISQFKGVTWDKARRRWASQIKVNGKHLVLGRYKSETEAAKAYDEAAKKHFGEFARPNFS
jgi:hypothetical protein